MARLFSDETDINAWRALIGAFNYLDMIVSDNDRCPALAARCAKWSGPHSARLGWDAEAGRG